jgi:hypothetical protein
MRSQFDRHVEAIAAARSLFTAESTPAHVLASAEPEAIEAWQQLDGHLRVITKIAAVASQFGPRLGDFPRITEFALGENARLDDRAIMCTAGPLVVDIARCLTRSAHCSSNLTAHTLQPCRWSCRCCG